MRNLVGVMLLLSSVASFGEPPAETLKNAVERAADNNLEKNPAPFMHAMRGPQESVEDARLKINAWIRHNFQKAFTYKSKGDTQKALFYYFVARHALRDSTSPLSNDEMGNPAILEADQSPRHQELPKHYWRDKVDEDTQSMFDSNTVPGGDLLRMYGIDTKNGPVDRPSQTPKPLNNRLEKDAR